MASPSSVRPLKGEHPVLQALRDAPLDDEPETAEEREAVEEARRDIAAGRVYSDADVQRMLGAE